MTIERGSSKRCPAASGSQPTWCFSTDVRTSTQPGLRAATARIVGDLKLVLVLIVATTRPFGLVRSCARRRTTKASGPVSLGAAAGLAAGVSVVAVVAGAGVVLSV